MQKNEVICLKLYHAARAYSLDDFIGKKLPLVDDEISYHGLAYSNPRILDGSYSCFNVLIEHFFELIRAARHPDKPSRFVSLFGCAYEEMKLWKDSLNLNENSSIYEVEGVEQARFDGALLALGPYLSGQLAFWPKLTNIYADAYWSQASGDSLRDSQSEQSPPSVGPPRWEYLIQFPVFVHRKLDKQEVREILGLDVTP